MYIHLKEDIISHLSKFIGGVLPNNTFRSGRIEYTQYLENNSNIYDIELDDGELERLENSDAIKEYIESKIKYIGVDQYFWTEKRIVISTGLQFTYTSYHIRSLLAQMFYITDILGEPEIENSRTIEWTDIDNNLKIIIILPKKHSKDEESLSIILGKKNFLDNTEIWKINL